jgi:hypothetical protein
MKLKPYGILLQMFIILGVILNVWIIDTKHLAFLSVTGFLWCASGWIVLWLAIEIYVQYRIAYEKRESKKGGFMKHIIVIKTDMEEMPKDCENCILNEECKYGERIFDTINGKLLLIRPNDCPLSEMPTREEAREILITMKDDNSTTMNISNDIVEVSDGIERALDKLGYTRKEENEEK